MNIRKFNVLIIVFVVSLVVQTCTENPLFKEKINTVDRKSINGRVTLQDSDNNSNIIVYLDGLDKITVTDNDGNFEIELSEGEVQSNDNLTGLFKIYYYVANYKYEYSIVFINKGTFVYDLYNLDAKGKINKTISLKKIIDIETSISENSIAFNYKEDIFINMVLTNYMDSVSVTSNMIKENQFASVILKSENDEILINAGVFYSVTSIIKSTQTWFMILNWEQYGDPRKTGEFEIIPYIQINQEGLPDRLLRKIGKESTSFSTDFLKLPIRRTNPTLLILSQFE